MKRKKYDGMLVRMRLLRRGWLEVSEEGKRREAKKCFSAGLTVLLAT